MCSSGAACPSRGVAGRSSASASAGSSGPPYLTGRLLDLIEAVHAEAIPIGEGGGSARPGGAMGAVDDGGGGGARRRGGADSGKAPAWMRPQ